MDSACCYKYRFWTQSLTHLSQASQEFVCISSRLIFPGILVHLLIRHGKDTVQFACQLVDLLLNL